MNKYECSICGYIYDPVVGDAEAMIPGGTAFDDLPEDWTCPVCRVDKSNFVEINDSCSKDCSVCDNPEDKAPQNTTRIDGSME